MWTDEGSGGQPGSVWRMSPLNVVTAVKGHDVPKVNVYQLRQDKFYLQYSDDLPPEDPRAHLIHEHAMGLRKPSESTNEKGGSNQPSGGKSLSAHARFAWEPMTISVLLLIVRANRGHGIVHEFQARNPGLQENRCSCTDGCVFQHGHECHHQWVGFRSKELVFWS